MRIAAYLFAIVIFAQCPALALDRVSFERAGKTQHVSGRVITTAQDGGMLMLGEDGRLWGIQPDEIVKREKVPGEFEPWPADRVARELRKELGAAFEIHRTANYVICHNTSRAYAAWCGALLERLHSAFLNFWKHKGVELSESPFPLVAIVLKDRESYLKYAKARLGASAGLVSGFYNLQSNRVIMYDLTGGAAGLRATRAQINRLLSRPESATNVATVVHEATHQIAFNCGMHARTADIPLWVTEGMAVFFETPDLKSPRGWRTIGKTNGPRLVQYRSDANKRGADSLDLLTATDDRFRSADTARSAYAEAWALTHFLINSRPKQYVAYLKQLQKKEPQLFDDEASRIKQFSESFGGSPKSLAPALNAYIRRLR
ncbi:MAG: DUF1570 domain-containing protein [Pirellulales bacterium]|nr:DUF1570 domain-containing protein [Pirellulales bacterium]